MTDVGVDTYRLSYAEKTGGRYQGSKNEIPNIGNVSACRDTCISTIGCQSWYYDNNTRCFISGENPGNFLETPSFPNHTAGKVANSRMPDPGLIAFWALLAFFLLLIFIWLTTSRKGVMALTGKIPYYNGNKFHTFQPLDKVVL